MITLPREGRYFFFLLLSFVFFFLSIYGGMDAWQYWWIKSGYSGYTPRTMTVSSVETWEGRRRSRWMGIRGVIDGVSVHDRIRLNARTKGNAYLKSLQPGESVDFYCRGPFKENQEVSLIEASFINAPQNRIWWVPVVSLVAAIFFCLFLFDKHRPPFNQKRSPKRCR